MNTYKRHHLSRACGIFLLGYYIKFLITANDGGKEVMKRRLDQNPGMSIASIGIILSTICSRLLYLLFAVPVLAYSAENISTPPDTNSWITVENAVVKGNETTVFFFTRPDIRDPEARNPCALNYYSVTLSPGLPAARPEVVAKGVCGGAFQKSRLLDNGDALIIVRDRLERWRGGEKINSEKFSSIAAVSKLGVSTEMAGGQFYNIAPNGNVVLAVQAGDRTQDASEYAGIPLVITAMKPDGKRRWETRFIQEGIANNVEQVWAGSDGSALLNTAFIEGALAGEEARLYFISASGSKSSIALNRTGKAMDFESMNNKSQEEVMKLLQQQDQFSPESIERLGAVPGVDGGFDVLFQRKGGGEGREGFFLYRLGANGELKSQITLGDHIETHGLERWFDFYVEGNQLTLMSKAPVTQKVVRGVKKKWGQIVVSGIDLDTGIPSPRLVPLDKQYLEAAMNAGDEGQQYLDGQPGSEPVLLTKLGGRPLVVSVGWVSKRQVVRLHEADETLLVFTEVVDEKKAKTAREASRKQRSADRDAQSQRMNAAMAAAAGMSEKEFNALSNREQKEALIRSGNSDQLLNSMMRESQAMQAQQAVSAQNTPQQQAGIPQDTNAQLGAAMAEAQQQMDNDPNVTPEMRAQMAAVLAQLGQGPGGQPGAMPGIPAQAPPRQASSKQVALPDNALKVDSGKRGFIEFENPDGRLITLLIFDRKTGSELVKRDYPDGVIYEYIDFSRFNLPLEQIGILYREVGGLILKDLTPVVAK